MFKRLAKIFLWFILATVFVTLLMIAGLFFEVRPKVPRLARHESILHVSPPVVNTTPDSLFFTGNNKFRKNRYGLYEMYVEGNGFERGLSAGALSSDLVKYQEEVFVQKITEVIPSERYRSFLLTLIIWFNSKLHKEIHPEFIDEIYGISKSASEKFNFYGPAFYRILNYHAAHDIGHTLQAYNLVGCSSFVLSGEYTSDSGLLVGRNFDFYFGEEFSSNKIIEFVAPDEGHKFAFVTWGGMTGAVSGMNQAGLSITINAGTPSIAKRSGTPVSLLAREILQFASTIQEADSIARNRRTFVSESYLVASAIDNRAVIIEKTPYEQELVEASDGKLLCTNHYQGKITGSTEENDETMQRATGYRIQRLEQLIDTNLAIDYQQAARILRDQKGLNNKNLGLANEMALNQLIAHHSVIFSPQKKIMWVSTPPYNLGSYLAYDLNTVFETLQQLKENKAIDFASLEIAEDDFLSSSAYIDYTEYRKLKEKYIFFNFTGKPVHDSIHMRLIELNPNNFEPYLWKANQTVENGDLEVAIENYRLSLQKEMPIATRNTINEKLSNLEKEE